MCGSAVTQFSCGCEALIPGTLRRCACADLAGRTCPDFMQQGPDYLRAAVVAEPCNDCRSDQGKDAKKSRKFWSRK